MKKTVEIDKEKLDLVRTSFNSVREPENDWQSLLKEVIQQVMDDYIRLQHPTRRNQTYLKEAFCSAISCLWDEDYQLVWPSIEKDQDLLLSFREVLAQRFGIDSLSKNELSKINMGYIQSECIENAKKYWIDKQLEVVQVPDFFVFDGRAFSIWRTDEESSIDYEEMVIYLENIKDERELNQTFIELTMEIIAFYRDIKIKKEVLDSFASAWYETLRMNSCFR